MTFQTLTMGYKTKNDVECNNYIFSRKHDITENVGNEKKTYSLILT